MEIVIVLCLILIIILLLLDKINISIHRSRESFSEKVNPELPDIMGQPKPIPRLLIPNTATESQDEELPFDPDNLDIEYDENEIVGIQIPREDLDDVFGTLPDLEEEEEELDLQGTPIDDFGFAQGVTFEELAKVGKLLQHEKLAENQKSEAIEIVQKIQGTELFYLLESSIEGASQKIAKLLDSSLAGSTESGSTNTGNENISGFDIGEFV